MNKPTHRLIITLTEKPGSLEACFLIIIERSFHARGTEASCCSIPTTTVDLLPHLHILTVTSLCGHGATVREPLTLVDTFPVHQNWGAGRREEGAMLGRRGLLKEGFALMMTAHRGDVQRSVTI